MPYFALLLTLVGLAVASPAKIDWQQCADIPLATCAAVTVPVDYARPSGPTMRVALARIPAADPAKRRGVLLLNPGGPGAGGRELLAAAPQLFPELAEHYDLIGMDPRFTGASGPTKCDWKTDTFLRSAGPDRHTFDRSVALMRQLAAACTPSPYATTRNTARDMDLIRRALGEPKLNYLGYSYGSYLGAVYLQMFGANAGRFVIDSAVDPAVYGPSLFARNAPAMQDALREWARFAAAHDDEYHLGATIPAALATIDRLHRPLRIGSYRVDAEFLPFYLFSRLNQADYVTLSAELMHFGSAGTLPESLSSFLHGFFTGEGNPADRHGTPILCADRAVSRDPGTYYRDIQAHRRSEPFFGPLTRNISPCAFWPVRGAEPPTTLGNDRPVLVVGADHDPITPYPGQIAMRRVLRGSSAVTLHGAYRHTVYEVAGSACVDRVVTGYLLGSDVPRTTECFSPAAPGR